MVLTDRYKLALLYAIQASASQFRKGTRIPYFAHLLSVSALVIEDGGDEDKPLARGRR
jgi:(p)ppGpp synthase/HD superfamily hydrolase